MKCVKSAQNVGGRFRVVRGHPTSSAMPPFDKVHTTSYSSLIETMHLILLYRFQDTASYLSKFGDFALPYLHLVPPLGMTLVEFRKDFWQQNTKVPGPSCGIVCMILWAVIYIQYRLVTDRQADTRQLMPC